MSTQRTYPLLFWIVTLQAALVVLDLLLHAANGRRLVYPTIGLGVQLIVVMVIWLCYFAALRGVNSVREQIPERVSKRIADCIAGCCILAFLLAVFRP